MQLPNARFLIPGMLAGVVLLGGATAHAFYPGAFNAALFDDFTEAQQEAIVESFEIRQNAEAAARAVLENAGVEMSDVHTAMHQGREERRKAMDAALEANDYEAFQSLVAGRPMAEELTEDKFAKLVEAHRLRTAGDFEGAHAIMKELGIGGMGMGKGFGHGHGHPKAGE